MLKIYFELYLPSRKKLNPLIGFTISDLGYDAEYSLTQKENIRKTPDLLETIILSGENKIETLEPVLFDFGALGKGYAVDKISELFKARGVDKFLVNGSGDIYYKGTDKIRVGLEDPNDSKKVIATTEMSEGAMCASGINKRKWRNFHHVIDPETSSSSESNIVSSWVIAQNTALADALASCLFFVKPEDLSSFKFEYCILNENRQAKCSPNFGAEFFS
jgi:thiamine biosynthesis lipoprotein